LEPDIALWRERAAQVRRLAKDPALDAGTRNAALDLAHSWEEMAAAGKVANSNRAPMEDAVGQR
jgi:hypothetical protein